MKQHNSFHFSKNNILIEYLNNAASQMRPHTHMHLAIYYLHTDTLQKAKQINHEYFAKSFSNTSFFFFFFLFFLFFFFNFFFFLLSHLLRDYFRNLIARHLLYFGRLLPCWQLHTYTHALTPIQLRCVQNSWPLSHSNMLKSGNLPLK